MAVVEIVQVPNPILTTKCQKVTDFGPQTQEIINNLMDTLNNAKNPEGAGLAAPQIGITKRICIVRRFITDTTGQHAIEPHILVNPEIYGESKETDIKFEGCLSIPNTYGRVKRYRKIKVKAQDRFGNEIKPNVSGFFARVIQHEIDHLNGILFTDKIIGKTYTETEMDALELGDDSQ
jgi:peptide deformylase